MSANNAIMKRSFSAEVNESLDHARGGISGHSDVDTAGAVDGNALVYDEGTGTWLPGAGGGGVGLEDKDRNTLQVIEFALFS